jgi:cytochrome c553
MTRLLISSLAAMLLIGCGDSAQNSASSTPTASTETAKPVPAPLPEPAAQPEAPESEVAAAQPAAAPVEKTEAEPAPVATEPTPAAAKPTPVVAKADAPTSDGKALYNRCASCHGTHAEKSALNASQIIAGWEAEKTAAALKGYKDGTYGGKMKATMTGQASRLSDADIDALAAYIATLKP